MTVKDHLKKKKSECWHSSLKRSIKASTMEVVKMENIFCEKPFSLKKRGKDFPIEYKVDILVQNEHKMCVFPFSTVKEVLCTNFKRKTPLNNRASSIGHIKKEVLL